VLVVPDGAAPDVEAAVKLLRGTIRKISGADLAVVPESQGVASLLPIYIGPTRFTREKGVYTQNLRSEEIALLISDSYIILAGHDGISGPGTGTFNASVELLQRLGVRWLWPGESGEVIPRLRTIELARLDYRYAPVLQKRAMRLGQPGWDVAARLVKDKFGDVKPPPMGDWGAKMRLGSGREIRGGHSFGDWYKRHFKTKPDLFARGEDGQFGWIRTPDRSKLCYSNPEVLELVVAEAREYYSKQTNPELTCFPIGPTDGSAGWCMCPKCKALDNPNGPMVTSNVHYRDEQGKILSRSIRHVSLTDRHAKFWNQVAQRVQKDCPGMSLGAYAYSVFRSPPIEVTLDPHVVIGYVSGSYVNGAGRQAFLKGWRGWSEKCSQMYWRPNLMKNGEGFPLVWATKMGRDIQTLTAQAMKGIEMPNCFGHWGTQGLNYYVLAQMMWDPSQDPGAIVDDYCQRGFGAAGPKVRQYVARLEEFTHLIAVHEAGRIGNPEELLAADEEPDAVVRAAAGQGASGWETVWTDQAMQELQSILIDAANVVESSTPEAMRIAVLQDGLDFAKLELPARRYLAKYEQDPSDENAFGLALECARVERWMLAHPQSRGVAVIEGYGWWWRKMRVPPIVRGTLSGRAVGLGDGNYRLSIAAYSSDGRYTTVQFSEDGGSTWSAEEPFKVDHEYKPARKSDKIVARLTLKSAATKKQVETIINLK
jgi:hypothetical protein